MKRILLALLRIYKIALSPYFGSQCRFLPTCSDYAREAVVRHGAARGSWMAACRLCRCHPFAHGGYDPVPPSASTPPADRSGRTAHLDPANHVGPAGMIAAKPSPVSIRLPRP